MRSINFLEDLSTSVIAILQHNVQTFRLTWQLIMCVGIYVNVTHIITNVVFYGFTSHNNKIDFEIIKHLMFIINAGQSFL